MRVDTLAILLEVQENREKCVWTQYKAKNELDVAIS
jgi:hypothetical protein